MAAELSGRRDSNVQLLEELEALSQSLYQPHTSSTRRTASLSLPRVSVPSISSPHVTATTTTPPNEDEERPQPRPHSRRMSLSYWLSRPNLDEYQQDITTKKFIDDKRASSEKKGIWNWKPIRALSHLGMHKLSCLFSVEVVTVQGLPASMNGLRLCVCVRKKETRDRAVMTMPARVLEGAADFEESLFVRCHLYYSSSGGGKQLKFEPRPFWIYVIAVDAKELDFGRSSVDLSLLVQESVEKSLEGTRVRQLDVSYDLSGKAKGGELVLKLGFQIMEVDGGLGIYSQAEGLRSGRGMDSSSRFARKQSKSSFSIPNPRIPGRMEAFTPSKTRKTSVDFQEIDVWNLDEPAPAPSTSSSIQKSEEMEPKVEDLDLPDFEVVDKGVEIQDKTERSVSSEVVKEVVNDQFHLTRLRELDSIAQLIEALQSKVGDENLDKTEDETESQRLDAEEETVTRGFLQMLEGEEANEFKLDQPDIHLPKLETTEEAAEAESKVFLSDLGEGLGSVVQTRDGGYLAAMNPFNVEVTRKETPKIAMQISKPLILPSYKSMSGFEILQRWAAVGIEELSSEFLSLMPIDELMGKTAEQVAFEGIASAIIQGRNKEGASSSAARTIAAVKSMTTATSTGRKERISMGIWNVNEEPVMVDKILAFSIQKIESMAVEALKVQADMADKDAPFEVSPLVEKTEMIMEKEPSHVLASAVPLEDWLNNGGLTTSKDERGNPATLTLSVVVQLRDPMRRYETVGGPLVALIQATPVDDTGSKAEEERFKVTSLHIAGLKGRAGEKQRLTAMQWLVAYGLGKTGRKGKHIKPKVQQDSLWSLSSRIMANMWLKPMRNPDIRFPEQE
ncbi:protein PLASTID MOVEMENT IMPAIRED 1-like [Macadamia integrifolia]|uniref:protein PLASTID MOVEMENT IMPAIRED 1-like n=1 Tax=Macadamia integrifolia TaxID=60698 RepID=UPI001C50093F|nr:protein PLASTID MOVEMENT IMPAIRED 1-like [Macadamia integrifolia]